MKTRLVEQLNQAPVEPDGYRVTIDNPVITLVDESDHEKAVELEVAEAYRFEARIGARFVIARSDNWPQARNYAYENLKRSITEEVYGEVREQAYKLVQLGHELQCSNNFRRGQEVIQIASNILEMTKP